MKVLKWATGQSISSNNNNYYRIIQLLGEGKSATAYLALKTGTNERGTFHVVKLMQHPEEQLKLNNFNKEKVILTNLKHSSVIGISDEGEFMDNTNKYPFYISDFYSNTLESLIKQSSLKLTQKLSYAIQLCSALSHLNSRSIVHCDIKPGNIYVDGLKCVLADFGLSIDTDSKISKDALPSLHKYRSPDIVNAIRNNAILTPKSDVFQLGLVLAELFTGSNPCKVSSSGEDKVHIDYIPDIYGRFGKNINTILESMLRETPEERPEAEELIDKWQGILFKAYKYMLKIERNVY